MTGVGAATATVTAATPVAAPPTTTMVPEVRDELTGLMQELLLKTHELSFEYSTMECDEIGSCPLARKAKELFRVVKRLNEIVKKLSAPGPSTYV